VPDGVRFAGYHSGVTTTLRVTSATEYASWYLDRENRKPGRDRIPPPQDPVAFMEARHSGKWRQWLSRAEWSLISLSLEEFRRLIFPSIDWSERQDLVVDDGPHYRLLERVARRAIEIGYLDRSDDPQHRHQRCSQELRSGSLHLNGESRIAVCSAESETARNPSGRWYLLDGAGRCLLYMSWSASVTSTMSPWKPSLPKGPRVGLAPLGPPISWPARCEQFVRRK
jgi:hypothetical protein